MPRAVCGLCEWAAEEVTRHAAGSLASWHVYEQHPDTWRSLFGDRPPIDPDPRTAAGRQKALAEAS